MDPIDAFPCQALNHPDGGIVAIDFNGKGSSKVVKTFFFFYSHGPVFMICVVAVFFIVFWIMVRYFHDHAEVIGAGNHEEQRRYHLLRHSEPHCAHYPQLP